MDLVELRARRIYSAAVTLMAHGLSIADAVERAAALERWVWDEQGRPRDLDAEVPPQVVDVAWWLRRDGWGVAQQLVGQIPEGDLPRVLGELVEAVRERLEALRGRSVGGGPLGAGGEP